MTMQRDPRFYSASDELRFSRYMWGMVQDEYRRQPSLLPRCAALNLVGFFIGGKNWIATLLNAFVQIPYLLIACFGVRVAAARRAGSGLWLVVAFAVYYVGIHLPFLAIARYSVPLTPLLCAPAGIALAAWLDRGAQR